MISPISLSLINSGRTTKLLKHYNEIIKKEALYSRIYPLNDTPQIVPAFKDSGYEYEDWQNFLLRIDRPIDEIWTRLKKSRKYGINRAKKKGVVIEEMEDIELLPTFYELLQLTYKDRNNPLEDISNFEAVFDLLVPKNMAKFFLAKYKDRYIAALLILLYKGVCYEWYIGSSKKRDDLLLYPNDLIVWYAIELCAKNGFHTFDFGGGGTKTKNVNIRKYKKHFGAEFPNYGRYKKIYSPIKVKIAEIGFEAYRRVVL